MKTGIRSIQGRTITDAVAEIYIQACTVPDPLVEKLLRNALDMEQEGPGMKALLIELENLKVAGETSLPICQDTGTAVVFAEIGNLVCIEDGPLAHFVNLGIEKACETAYLRPSQVYPPLSTRKNTGKNAPAVLYIQQVKGSGLKFSVLAKGAGCENVSRSEMLPPLAGEDGVMNLAEQCVKGGASRACPPVILGIGIGGTLETSGILAKKALLREPGERNQDEELAILETGITERLNRSGIGAQGFGGKTTVLETRIIQLPCHMASLPVTVCVECHVHRTASCTI